jgi:hypothetical protein
MSGVAHEEHSNWQSKIAGFVLFLLVATLKALPLSRYHFLNKPTTEILGRVLGFLFFWNRHWSRGKGI